MNIYLEKNRPDNYIMLIKRRRFYLEEATCEIVLMDGNIYKGG
jgi:hypothetical protein